LDSFVLILIITTFLSKKWYLEKESERGYITSILLVINAALVVGWVAVVGYKYCKLGKKPWQN